jgi:small conductance mechanosensitive channel
LDPLIKSQLLYHLSYTPGPARTYQSDSPLSSAHSRAGEEPSRASDHCRTSLILAPLQRQSTGMQLTDFLLLPYRWIVGNWTSVVFAAISFVAGWYVANFAARSIPHMLPPAAGFSSNFGPLLSQAARYGIIIFALMTALGFLGVPSATLLTVLGAMGLAIALALQNTLANIAAGIMLILLRPIAVGEYIVGDGVAGVVVEIGLFGTRLRSTSGLYVFTPNLKLWNSAITNHSRNPYRRVEVSVTVPDTINVNRIRHLLLGIAEDDGRVAAQPAAEVNVVSFTGDTVTVQLRAWVPTPQYQPALRDLTEKTKVAVKSELTEGVKAEVAVGEDAQTSGKHNPASDK